MVTIFVWAVIWLVTLDISVGLLFAYPMDPRETNPGAVALYFDYGRSMEARLRRATRADPDESAPITTAGWYEPLVASERPEKEGSVEVSVYGMSHAVRLAEALHEVSPRYEVRSVGAPGATTNWAYGAFLRDAGRGDSKVAVLAIMSSTLPMILSPAPMNWNTSFALPYTADRFTLVQGGGLLAIAPPYESFDGYVRTLNNPEAWEAALAQFARTDPLFDPFLVRQNLLDHSVLFRLVRRAWSQRRDQALRGRVLTAEGYDPGSEPVRTANAMVADFARRARREGIVPVIYIVDSFGYGDQLSRSLRDTLARDNVPHVATHRIVSPMDPGGYLPDSHFTEKNDRRIAAALERVLDRELKATVAVQLPARPPQ
jgi:hypothetical protein